MRNFQKFCIFLNEVRAYFLEKGFLETPTPTLVSCPGMEAHLDPLQVDVRGQKLFLPTSPEIHLKKYLCQGLDKIFELRPCFRNDPTTPLHQTEFFMLEWYRAEEPLLSLQQDVLGLLEHLKAKGFWSHDLNVSKTSFKTLFLEKLKYDLRADTSLEDLQNLFSLHEIYHHESDTKEDLFHRFLLEKFESSQKGGWFLEDFPPEMAVLSCLNDEGFARRFEFYMDGVELANAFFEVTDPALQKKRWEADVQERKRLNKLSLQYDEELIQMMESPGMPEASGIALGLDRLFMVGMGLKDLKEIRS